MAEQRLNTPNDLGRPFNKLLRRFSGSDFALVAPHLAHEEAKADDLLYNPGDNVMTSRAGRFLYRDNCNRRLAS
jgi:hypothetical protein